MMGSLSETAVAEGLAIPPPDNTELKRRVSSSLGLAPSPPTLRQSPSWGTRTANAPASTKHLKPFNSEDIKILLLENVNQTGRDILNAQGYQVTSMKSSLPEDELIERIRWGNNNMTLRSKTHELMFGAEMYT